MTQPADVVIVGGAIMGSAAAYFLATQPGFQGSVRVLEKDFSYADSATARSAASIRHQFSTPENIRLSQFGTQFLRDSSDLLAMGNDRPDVAFQERGYLFLASPAGRAVLTGNHRVQRDLEVDVALLDSAALAQRFSWLATGDLGAGSLGLAGEGWFDAYGLMRALRKKAIALGVTYQQAEVTDLVRDGRRITAARLADDSLVEGGTFINTAGTGAAQLVRSAAIDLPVEPRKRCVFYFTTPAQLPACPLVVDVSGAWFRPEGAGFIAGISPAEEDDPLAFNFDVQHQLWDEVLWPLLAARVPGFEAARVQSAWAGHYDVNTLDHNVILGAHPDVDNLLFANGFSGHGVQHAPGIGRALAECITYGAYRTLDLSRFGWQRVLDEKPLREINVV
jgi:FAD-dependent oxidoreductase domain-containing protein 1